MKDKLQRAPAVSLIDSTLDDCSDGDLRILTHHIYEYRKGLRNLVLHTIPSSMLPWVEARLNRDRIGYSVMHISPDKVNIFFGDDRCVQVVDSFGPKKLNHYTPEEDFILGIMLGYCRMTQCNRYLNRRRIQYGESTDAGPACCTGRIGERHA
jgi:hypothetical protein